MNKNEAKRTIESLIKKAKSKYKNGKINEAIESVNCSLLIFNKYDDNSDEFTNLFDEIHLTKDEIVKFAVEKYKNALCNKFYI